MSVDAFSGLPFQAGQAVAAGVGRTAKWAIGAYMRAPLRNSAIAALTTLCAMAGSNALYNQSHHHPAPLFGSFGNAAKAEPAPVMPLERPVKLLAEPSPETTGSIATTPEPVAARPIGNDDVFEVQRRLTAFKLFDGKVDGLYGPRTARSVKAFEASLGMAPTGKLTPAIIELIKSTPITAEPGLKTETVAVVQPAPVTAKIKTATPALALVEETPAAALPAPAPLVANTEPAPLVEAQEPVAVATAEPELSPTVKEEGISTLEMTSPPEEETATAEAAVTAPIKRAVQTIAVRATLPEAAPAADIVTTPIDVTKVANDPKIVGAIQRGLASLGFLHGEIDGVAGEATAKAIRNFEVYYNYNVTGRITPELVNLLVQNGAVI
jgi:peptidoglycan hydrolase-like protein with peptidoglycan-binding domain